MKSKLINLMAVLLIAGNFLIHSENTRPGQASQVEQVTEIAPQRISLKQVTWETLKLCIGASMIVYGTGALIATPFIFAGELTESANANEPFNPIASTILAGGGALFLYLGAKINQSAIENIEKNLQEIKKANKKARQIKNTDLAANQ